MSAWNQGLLRASCLILPMLAACSGGGQQAPTIELAPTTCAFGTVGLGETASADVTVSNGGTAMLFVSGMALEGAAASDYLVAGVCGPLAPQAACTLTVSFTPTAAGARSASLVIDSNDPTTPHATVLASDLVVDPSPVDFGVVRVHEAASRTLTLQNTGGAALHAAVVVGGTDPGDFAAAGDCATVAPAGDCALTLTFTPSWQALRNAVLEIDSDDPQEPTVTIQLHGEGTDAPGYPTVSTTFVAYAPANTPAGEAVNLIFLDLDSGVRASVAMTADGNGTWTATHDLLVGTDVRYAYQRGAADVPERFSADLDVAYRDLHVFADTTAVEDVIAMWGDLPLVAPLGGLHVEVQSAGGAPITDAYVGVAGLRVLLDHEGHADLSNVPAGPQRVTLVTSSGQYRPLSTVATVPASGQASVALQATAAPVVPVTFSVEVPPDTPPGEVVRVYGTRYPLGAAWEHVTNALLPDWPQRWLPLAPSGPGRYSVTVDLHAGCYARYRYTLADREVDAHGAGTARDLVVPEVALETADHVAAWGWTEVGAVEFRVTVPLNTPGPVYLENDGWTVPMDPIGPRQWGATFRSLATTFNYRYLCGEDTFERFEPDDLDHRRSFTGPATGTQVQQDTVDRWRWIVRAEDPAGSPLAVTFWASVPPNTPAPDRVYVAGDRTELSGAGVALTRSTTNPWLWSGTVTFANPGTLHYWYSRGSAGTEATDTHTTELAYDGQALIDAVPGWNDLAFDLTRPFFKGRMLPDFWSSGMLPRLPSTFDAARTHAADWIVIVDAWNYDSVSPLPVLISPGAVRWLSREEITDVVAAAHARGLKVLLEETFDSPSGGLDSPHSTAWWQRWLVEADAAFASWAVMAEDAGVDMLMLAGPYGNVWADAGHFEDAGFVPTYEAGVSQIIAHVRSHYSGLLGLSITDLSQTHPFFAEVDYLFPRPEEAALSTLPTHPSVAQIEAVFDAWQDALLQPLHDLYGKPMIVHMGCASATGTLSGLLTETQYSYYYDDDPSVPLDLEVQASYYEAVFRSTMNRSLIDGIFTFGYGYDELGRDKDYGQRGKPAEAVIHKYYQALDPLL